MQGTKGIHPRLQSTSVLKRSVGFCNGNQHQASLFYAAFSTQPLNTISTAFLISELLLKTCSCAACIPKHLLLPRIEGCRKDKEENYFGNETVNYSKKLYNTVEGHKASPRRVNVALRTFNRDSQRENIKSPFSQSLRPYGT